MSLRALLEARSAHAIDLDESGRVLVRSDETGTLQLAEYHDGALRRVTDLAEPVTGRYVPGTRAAVVAVDSGSSSCTCSTSTGRPR